MATQFEDDRTPGHYYVTINKNPKRGPFMIYREGVRIGGRDTLDKAVAAVLMTFELLGPLVSPWETT